MFGTWMSHGLDGIHKTAYGKITQPTVAGSRAHAWELSVVPCWTPSKLQGWWGEGSCQSATGIWSSLLLHFPFWWTLNMDPSISMSLRWVIKLSFSSKTRWFPFSRMLTLNRCHREALQCRQNHLRGGGTGKLPLRSSGCYFYQASLTSASAGLKPDVNKPWKQQSWALSPAPPVVSLELGFCLIINEAKVT